MVGQSTFFFSVQNLTYASYEPVYMVRFLCRIVNDFGTKIGTKIASKCDLLDEVLKIGAKIGKKIGAKIAFLGSLHEEVIKNNENMSAQKSHL